MDYEMYALAIKPAVDKIFSKLAKKDKVLMQKVASKIEDIRWEPKKRYEFLKGNLKGLNRVHIADHFVLIFHLNHEDKICTVVQFSHHNDAYE